MTSAIRRVGLELLVCRSSIGVFLQNDERLQVCNAFLMDNRNDARLLHALERANVLFDIFELNAEAMELDERVKATFAMQNALLIYMPRITRAIRAHLRSVTERRLGKRLLSFLGIAIIALCHRVAHDNDFARIAGRARLARLRVTNANLGTRSRRTRRQRHVARKFGFTDLAIRHGHGRFGWAIRVRHDSMRKTLAKRSGRRMTQRLAAEKKQLHARKHAFGKRRIDQAQISERRGRNPYRHVGFRQIGEQ